MLAAAANTAAGGAGPGPTGPPTDVSIFKHTGDLVGVQWSNGDTLSFTQIGFGALGTPETVTATVNPFVTSYETEEECSCSWYVRHIRNSQTSAWVIATGCDVSDCI